MPQLNVIGNNKSIVNKVGKYIIILYYNVIRDSTTDNAQNMTTLNSQQITLHEHCACAIQWSVTVET